MDMTYSYIVYLSLVLILVKHPLYLSVHLFQVLLQLLPAEKMLSTASDQTNFRQL